MSTSSQAIDSHEVYQRILPYVKSIEFFKYFELIFVDITGSSKLQSN